MPEVKITSKGKLLYSISTLSLFAILFIIGCMAYIVCQDNPSIKHIADMHIDALANGLMTYASISVGFILTEFALLLTFASNPFFKKWQKSGKFQLWQTLNLCALLSSVGVLVSSLVLLGWEETLPIAFGILAVNVFSMTIVFVPLLIATANILRDRDEA